MNLYERAYAFARERHAGQTKPGGRTMLSHIEGIVQTLRRYSADEACLAAATLHDTLEDTPTTLDEIRREFGAKVAFLVDGLTKYPQDRSLDYFEKIERTINVDRRALLIKASDVNDNLLNVPHFGEERRLLVKRTFREWVGFLATLAETETEEGLVRELTRNFRLTYRLC